DLMSSFEVVDRPRAVRRSSLLVASHYQPFAGIYATYMVPFATDSEARLRWLTDAIKGVYASVFYSASKSYMTATSNVIDQEKMAVIIQEVVGENRGECYFPSLSGVGRSLNYYPLGDEQPEDGVVELAVGLGKYIVDGGRGLRFSPRHAEHALQTSTLELALRDTQTRLFALRQSDDFSVETDEGANLVQKNVQDFADTGVLRYMVSTFDGLNGILKDYEGGRGRRVVTFTNILRDKALPLAEALDFMLSEGQTAMQRPVEIEFAANIAPKPDADGIKGHLYWLQIRPIIDNKNLVNDEVLDIPDSRLILRSTTALGNGMIEGVRSIVYVKPGVFDSLNNTLVVPKVQAINEKFRQSGEGYILIGPGRWGSSDSALGIPVRWADISAARVIVEASVGNYRVEPSQGTHFFQNLTSFGVGYFTVDQGGGCGFYDSAWLDSLPADYEDEYIRIVTFDCPLDIAINGRSGLGIIEKPKSCIIENTTKES
ncbi:MAG: PEP/pyruvate-binding domain-containing protein, partial [Muribaculaceae bacterium]|nr:PEP/pyruvate-binding domain-containing protein [Muribaculaceae bacterium]